MFFIVISSTLTFLQSVSFIIIRLIIILHITMQTCHTRWFFNLRQFNSILIIIIMHYGPSSRISILRLVRYDWRRGNHFGEDFGSARATIDGGLVLINLVSVVVELSFYFTIFLRRGSSMLVETRWSITISDWALGTTNGW